MIQLFHLILMIAIVVALAPAPPPPEAILVFGATGMTGRHVVKFLLDQDYKVKVVVRNKEKIPSHIQENPNLTVIQASIYDLPELELANLIRESMAVVSCLGHTVDFQGLFGSPYDLCAGMLKKVHKIVQNLAEEREITLPFKYLLMNTVAVSNPLLPEIRTWTDTTILFLLRYLLPPHADNENAGSYLNSVGKNEIFEWISVRPDSLIDDDKVTSYEVVESPKSTILDGFNTSRINVAHFMVDLLVKPKLWNKWKYQMPVIFDSLSSADSENTMILEEL